MSFAMPQSGFSRRDFLKGSALGVFTLTVGGWLAARFTDGSPVALAPMKYLSAAHQQMFAVLAECIVGDILPKDAAERSMWITRIVTNLDNVIDGIPLELRGDTQQLLAMLTFAPTRLAVTGQWTNWSQMSAKDVEAVLVGLRESGVETRRIVYRVLRDYVVTAFYGDRRSWTLFGYPGPLIDRPEPPSPVP